MKRASVLVPMDFDEKIGFFLREGLVQKLHSLGMQVLPLTYDIHALDRHLDAAAGVIIPGGLGDVDPLLYNEEAHHKTKTIESRSRFEMCLIEKSLDRNLPFLGICWGMQMANVFLGGNLIQDIASQRPSALPHSSENLSHERLGDRVFHPLHPSQRMQDLFKMKSEEMVNSTHHQAVDRLGKGLQAEAQSPDGIIEAASLVNHPFFWLVQWHPERLENDSTLPLFSQALLR